VVGEKRLGKFSEKKLQSSSNNCSVIATVKCSPLILVELGTNLLDLTDVTWNSGDSKKSQK